MPARHLLFRGHVQGVGFRYQTERIASHYQIYGYVKNLESGEVELVVEGESYEIDRFVEEVKTVLAINITESTATPITEQGYKNFQIFYT